MVSLLSLRGLIWILWRASPSFLCGSFPRVLILFPRRRFYGRDENELTGLLTKDFSRRAGKISGVEIHQAYVKFPVFQGARVVWCIQEPISNRLLMHYIYRGVLLIEVTINRFDCMTLLFFFVLIFFFFPRRMPFAEMENKRAGKSLSPGSLHRKK